jgi:outer membrane protein assembly complex protein YaeT
VVSAACAFLASAPGAQAAVSDYVGKPVASVRLMIENRETTDPMLTRMVETAVGQPLSMIQVRQSISRLFSLGRFEDVIVDAALDNGRVALRYDLRPIHPVTRIRFAGDVDAPGVDESALRRAIVDRYGVTPLLARAADMSRIIEEALGRWGYLHATATPHADIEHDPERATLVFTVASGVRTTIGRVDVVGRPTVSRSELLRRLGLTSGAPYQRDVISTGIERYVEDRRNQGYYEAKIVPDVQLTSDGKKADVTLAVTPGPRVRVVFNGDELQAERRDELVPVRREGSVDEDLLEDSSNRIEDYLRALGYRDAKAPHSRAEVDNELVITFTVTRGPLYRVARYDITGNVSVPSADFESGLRLRAGQPFADSRLDADAAALEELYRRRGFASARAQPGVQLQPGAFSALAPVNVVVSIAVVEGVRTEVESVTFSGNAALDDSTLRGKIGLQPGKSYVPGLLAVDRDAIELAYQDLGYESARVEATPQFGDDGTRANIRFEIQEGSRVYVDQVLIVGNVRTSAETIERELKVKPGDPFSLAAINEGQRRLTALGLFRRARITDVRHGETIRDLLVTVEEAPPTTIHYGGGLEGALRSVASPSGIAENRFEVAPRASLEIGRRNLFGKNRSVNLFTSVSLHPQNLNEPGSPGVGYPLTEYQVVGTFREPHLFDTAVDAFLNGTVEQQFRSTFNYARRSLSAELARRLASKVLITGSYQLQRTRVFDLQAQPSDQLVIDRLFPQFLLSSFSGSIIRDTRDDTVDTHTGEYTSANAQLSAQAIGSEVGFVKSFFTTQLFRTLPRIRRIVFAGDARLGMANGVANRLNPQGQLPASERFFAGGDSGPMRGFAFDQLGVRGETIDPNGFATGGNGLVIFNAELRAPVAGGLGAVGFIDTGNVFARVADIDLTQMRTAMGGGIRYKSPLGPLRVDIGFKVHPLPGEGHAAWFVSFGQAF